MTERRGYIWATGGFTKVHLWGAYITGSVLSAAGAGLLVWCVVQWETLSDGMFLRLALLSIACFAGATAVATGSIFTLTYFGGTSPLAERDARQGTTEDVSRSAGLGRA